VIRGTRLAAACCALVVAVAGCSTTEPGSPTGSDNPTSTPAGASSTRSTSSESSTKSPAANQNPCDLLSSGDASTLGVAAGKRKSIQGVDSCQWNASGKFSLTVGYSDKGLAGLTGAVKVDISKHEAMQVVDASGLGCSVVLATSPNSTVIVTVAPTTGSAESACPQAVNVAKIVDPKLS
jgi:hypothetical protein